MDKDLKEAESRVDEDFQEALNDFEKSFGFSFSWAVANPQEAGELVKEMERNSSPSTIADSIYFCNLLEKDQLTAIGILEEDNILGNGWYVSGICESPPYSKEPFKNKVKKPPFPRHVQMARFVSGWKEYSTGRIKRYAVSMCRIPVPMQLERHGFRTSSEINK